MYGVHRTCAETEAVSCGTSHAIAVSTPPRWIFKTRCKNLATHVESHASAVSLLESTIQVTGSFSSPVASVGNGTSSSHYYTAFRLLKHRQMSLTLNAFRLAGSPYFTLRTFQSRHRQIALYKQSSINQKNHTYMGLECGFGSPMDSMAH